MTSDPARLRRLVRRRLEGEPLQYLEGTAAFGPFELHVDPRVLIPRPETEGLWDLVRKEAAAPKVIVDLCTGSGALAIALQSSFPDAMVVGTDVSPEALEVARHNGETLAPRVRWAQGDLFAALDPALRGSVDLLVSNPPYVSVAEWHSLPADVRREPHGALVAGETGLEVLARIAGEAPDWMAAGGLIACEIGEQQGRQAKSLFGWCRSVEVRRDVAGRDRYVVAGT